LNRLFVWLFVWLFVCLSNILFSFAQMVAAKWKLCTTAAAMPGDSERAEAAAGGGGGPSGRQALLLSSLSGMEGGLLTTGSAAVEAYLQSTICALLNVTVLYPFRNPALLDAIRNTAHPARYKLYVLFVLCALCVATL
jgi:hypothetical protein